jgi:hypothetical protein
VRLVFLCVALIACGPQPQKQQPIDARACVAPRADRSINRCPLNGTEREPNGTMALATAPPSGSACDSPDGGVTGYLDGRTDVDVFRSGFCGDSQSDHHISATLDATPTTRVCVFARCQLGITAVYDCYQAQHGDSPDMGIDRARITDNGFRGCCRVGNGEITAAVQCSNPLGKKSVEGFVWVDPGDGDPLCDRYRVDYTIR